MRSLLKQINKIFREQLTKQLHGCRNKRSTITVLLEVVEKISEGLDGGNEVDLSKAFDNDFHEILPLKVEHYEVRCLILKLLFLFWIVDSNRFIWKKKHPGWKYMEEFLRVPYLNHSFSSFIKITFLTTSIVTCVCT